MRDNAFNSLRLTLNNRDCGQEKPRKQDKIERDNLKYNTAYTVITLRYDEDWVAKLQILAS